MADSGRPGGPAIWPRLALAFLGVALAAIAVLAGLTAALAAADVTRLASRQHTELTAAIAGAAGAERDRGNNWAAADLSPVLGLAARTGAAAQIRDRAGRAVAASPDFAANAGSPQLSAPIEIRGQRAGSVVVRFTRAGLGAADSALRIALLQAIAGAAGLAALLALVAGLVMARWITRPVERLIAVTRAMARGDRTARAGRERAPGELSELAAAFDQLADTRDREEQLRRDLVADVAHELRTPIAILQAGHEALLDGVTEPTPAQLTSLREEVLRVAQRVSDLQTLAEADAAALHLSLDRADLAAIAAAAAASLAGRFQAGGITVSTQLTPVEVLADQPRLHQVITNLLTNALKFTPPGGRVTIRAGPAGASAVLTVTDTGVGIPAADLPRMFDRFWRGRQAARTPGSGIGLALAAELARAQGGGLTASSREGRGTQLTLTLPRA